MTLKAYLTSATVGRPPALGNGQWQLERLTALTVLFGKNGSGKSILLRAWRDTDPNSIHYVIPERTGDIEYQANFLQEQLNANSRRDNSAANFIDNYRRRVVVRVQAYFSARGNVRAGQLPGDPADIEQLLTRMMPDFAIEISGTRNPPYKLTRTSDGRQVANIGELSSGEAQLFSMALDILTIAAIWDLENNPKRILLIDEPDAHIHPDLQVRFADFLVSVAEKWKLQVVVATHSTTLLAALGQFGGEHTSVLYLDKMGQNLSAAPFTSVLQELAACLGGHALMGPLFGVPMLLVEGDDDYRIWSQVPRHHQVSFSVLASHGEQIKQYQHTLERIFGVLKEEGARPSGYALVDADKGKPQANPDRPQNHIRFIQLACHETENLYLTDEVLADIGCSWAEAQTKILASADRFGAKAAALKAIVAQDRKTADYKGLIEPLAQIIDPKLLHWTVRVAKTIGVKRPAGQLREFLGEEVVSSLWGEIPTT